MKHLLRLHSIGRILAKHDALFLFEAWGIASPLVKTLKCLYKRKNTQSPGQRLAQALLELGPAFIKLGQSLSTRSDLLGEDIAADLAMLRDKLPPFPGEQAIATIEAEFGQPIEALFSSFDLEPVAAASIAQVHFAVDTEGNKVAVKVLRPGIEKQFDKDVHFLFWVAKQIEKRLPKYRRLKLQEVVQTFADTVRAEMDLRFEAAAAAEMAQNFAGDDTVHIPAVDWRRTSQRVLTLERVSGINIGDTKRLKRSKHKPEDIVSKAAQLLFKMAFRDGFFHADLHPGNIFVGKHGQLILVDFGIMGRLDDATRMYIAEMLHGFLTRDYVYVSDLHFEAGYVPNNQSRQAFAQACCSIAEPILGLPSNEISVARLLAQLFKISEDFQMELQPQLLLLQKSIMLAEGVGRNIYPEVNMWKLAEPLIEQWKEDNVGPGAALREGTKRAKQLVQKIENILLAAEQVVTPQGVRLHPDTIAALKKKATS